MVTKVYLSVAASAADLEQFSELIEGMQDISLGAARGIDNAGDGLAFPLDPDAAIESMTVLTAAFGTAKIALEVFSAWSKRRVERNGAKDMLPDPVIVTSITTGEQLYVGRLLDDAAVAQIRERLDGPRSE